MQKFTDKTTWHNYTIYRDGTIVSPRGRKIKPSLNTKGYLHCRLKVCQEWKTFIHHRIICEAFLGPCPEGREVNHKDGVRDNNNICNLEYVTKSENNHLSYDSGRRDVRGSKNANCKYSEYQVLEVKSLILCGYMPKQISQLTGVGVGTIGHIKRGSQWA